MFDSSWNMHARWGEYNNSSDEPGGMAESREHFAGNFQNLNLDIYNVDSRGFWWHAILFCCNLQMKTEQVIHDSKSEFILAT